jgi:signal transduction histidine kinase
MAAVVAHEIRNPVAGIAAGVEYLTRNAPQGSVEAEGGAMIQGEVKRVSRILEDILFVARPLQLNFSHEALPCIMESVIQRCQPQAQAGQVDISFEAEDHLPALYVDSQRLEQVFANLIINAIQAMPGGGRLLLQANLEPAGTHEMVIIKFTDTGPGIPADVQQRIFEPFFTTKAKGTGLGLSIARRIIDEHGGVISVTSRVNQGTCFTIKLPVTRG